MTNFYVRMNRYSLWHRLICLLLLLSSLPSLAQTKIYVSPTGTTTNPASATSWLTATSNLQGAIDVVGNHEVWVKAGIYKSTSTTSRTSSFSMAKGVTVYGGFVGTETNLADRKLTSPLSTTLSGDIGTLGNNADNSYHVINNPAGLDSTAILDGFVITGGNANGASDLSDSGGGMLNNGINRLCSPTIRNCLFQANTASSNGGAIYNDGRGNGICSPKIINCGFLNNSAAAFSGLNGTNGGGGLFNNASFGTSRPILTNCSFQGNTAGAGAAIFNYVGTSTATGVSQPVLINCVLYGNGVSSSAISFFGLTTSTNTSASYSLLDFALAGTGNLTTTTSPFASVTSLALSACSPAINAGLNSAAGLTTISTDLAGNTRIVGGRVDMGAVELQGTPFVAITGQPQTTGQYCAGTPVSVPVSVTGTVTSYSWLKDGQPLSPPQSSAALTLPNATTANTGTYSLSISGACNSVTSAAFNLTVNALPVAILSSANVCVGQAVSLSATSGINNVFLFSGPGAFSSTKNTITVTGLSAGTYSYSVIVVNLNGCANSATTSVTVNALPSPTLTASNSAVLSCAQTSLTLTAGGGLTYSFSAGVVSQTGNTGVVSTSGTYSVTATGSNGCVATTSIVVSPNTDQAPQITTQPISATSVKARTAISVSVVATGTGPLAYQWYKDGSPVAGQTSSTLSLSNVGLTTAQSGTYVCSVTNACASVTTTAFSLIVIPTTALEDPANAFQVTVYPNPVVNNKVELMIKGAIQRQVSLQVVDMTGQVVWERSIKVTTAEHTETLDLSNVAAGVLVLRASTTDYSQTKKILKL